jgi:hypothetical protein
MIRIDQLCADVALVVADQHHGGELPDCVQLCSYQTTVKNAFIGMPSKAVELPMIAVYPDVPGNLSQSYLNSAYSAEDQPVTTAKVMNWGKKRKLVSCRATNKNVRTAPACLTLARAPSSTQLGTQLGTAAPMDQMLQALGALMHQMMHGTGSTQRRTPEVNLTFTQPNVNRQHTAESVEPSAQLASNNHEVGEVDTQTKVPVESTIAPLFSGTNPSLDINSTAVVNRGPTIGVHTTHAIADSQPMKEHMVGDVKDATSNKRLRVTNATDAIQEMEALHVAATAKAKAKAANKAKAKKTPAPKVLCKKPAIESKTRPKCPKPDEGPVLYRGAKISASLSKKGWRVWKDASIVGKEVLVKFQDDREASFIEACKLVGA